jgi:hypothetical protein
LGLVQKKPAGAGCFLRRTAPDQLTSNLHFESVSAGEAATVPSLVESVTVSAAVVSVDCSAAADSLVAWDESDDADLVSSSAIAAVVSHPNNRETNTDANFRFTADPLVRS